MDVKQSSLIKLHYDVPKHEIPLVQFVNAAESLKSIIDDFNKELFDGKLNYDLYICTPEEGGLKEVCKILLWGSGLMWAALESDIGKVYVRGLTGNEPAHYAETAGKKTKELVQDPKIVSDMVVGFLSKETKELEEIGLAKEKHCKAYAGKNTIYQDCLNNKEVQGIGFDDTHDFPVPRTSFSRHITSLTRDETQEDPDWTVEVTDVIVYSPNWKREKNLVWRGDTNNFKDIAFVIEDEKFWKHVEIKDIDPDIKDNMRVQWAYIKQKNRITNVRVLKVITYNGKEISERLSGVELIEALGDYAHPIPDLQIDLLESLENIKYPEKKNDDDQP